MTDLETMPVERVDVDTDETTETGEPTAAHIVKTKRGENAAAVVDGGCRGGGGGSVGGGGGGVHRGRRDFEAHRVRQRRIDVIVQADHGPGRGIAGALTAISAVVNSRAGEPWGRARRAVDFDEKPISAKSPRSPD